MCNNIVIIFLQCIILSVRWVLAFLLGTELYLKLISSSRYYCSCVGHPFTKLVIVVRNECQYKCLCALNTIVRHQIRDCSLESYLLELLMVNIMLALYHNFIFTPKGSDCMKTLERDFLQKHIVISVDFMECDAKVESKL